MSVVGAQAAEAQTGNMSMGPLTFGQIEALWIANGGDPLWAPTMAGIALAESGGNPSAWNQNAGTGDNSVGLWQINYFGSLAPSRTAAYGSPDQLVKDPNAQAKAAVSILGGGPGITAWAGDKVGQAAQAGQPLSLTQVEALVQTQNLGSTSDAVDTTTFNAQDASWQDWLKKGLSGVGSVLDPGFTNPATGQNAVGGLAAVGQFFGDLTDPKFWGRLLQGGLGVLLFIMGLALFFSSTDTGKKAISEGKDVAAVAALA